ncbi:unnamed protein product [Caenorhabditis sp. 36 PRJEB53466]|nr:unnamed protein product [Caenorhabditis sp. 36 PRJEB53466]
MMSTSSSLLPTAPIGKQQVIDLKAGAILRENARKSALFFGCPLGVVLVLIVLTKSLFISYWIIREYETFDFRCSAWNGAPMDQYRAKRWALFEKSDPRKFSKTPEDDEDEDSITEVVVQEEKHKRPLYGVASRRATTDPTSDPLKIDARLDFGPLPPTFQRRIDSNHIGDVAEEEEEEEDPPMTTMVTLTNTQIVQLSGEEHGVVKMKTIRNRVEKIGSDEEQFIEIDIANAPRIYVSKIKSRHGGDQDEEHFDLIKELQKDGEQKKKKKNQKKKKGKGLKKAKKLAALAALNNSTTPVTRKPKKPKKGLGLGSKKSKNGEEVTKQPRHLVGKSSSAGPTPSPHPSSWINGVLDPQDPKFTNQGHVRGYPMQKASRLPVTTTGAPSEASEPPASPSPSPSSSLITSEEEKEQLKISESTRMMWNMDELKYTTFLAPKTTEQTRPEVLGEQREKETDRTNTSTTEKPRPGGMSKSEWEQKKEAFEAYTPAISKSDLQPPFHVHLPSSAHAPRTSTSSPPPPPEEEEEAKEEAKEEEKEEVDRFSYLPPSESPPYFVEVNEADTETIYVKDVTPMFRNILMERQEPQTTTTPYDPLHLEMEIAKLKESSTCLARMAFDVWCLFVLFSSVPFIMGICVPRWSLFVLHIVFDFLFLVIGFVSSLTIAIMASVMYFLIDEMTSDSLFEFLLVAFVIDIVLILYSIIVGIAYRCCCRLVDNSIKESSIINYSVSSQGEPV